ncbi:MAG: alpha/beta fold hydrolase [Paraglaciecola sp.]|nr:alpha/beta fold hydrolase [Paraglaciecola sp.]
MKTSNLDVQHSNEKQVHANGLLINFDSFGERSNPAVVLIMGLATQMIFWDEAFCRALASKGFWVVRFDNRDIGKSSWLNKDKIPKSWAFLMNVLFAKKLKASYQLTDLAQDTVGLMDALEIEKAHIVGASMGGMIAQLIAIEAPQRVLSLTSIMSTTGDRSLPRASNTTALQLLATPVKEKTAYLKQATKVWRILHGTQYPFEQERITHLLSCSRERGFNPDGISRQFAAILSAADRTSALRQLTKPTLVIHGDIDPLVPVECGVATANAIPQAKLKIYPGMGHTIPVEVALDVINEIVELAKSAN